MTHQPWQNASHVTNISDKGCWDKEDREKNGSGYEGKQSFTVQGYDCQKWTNQTPHPHPYSPLNQQ